MTGGTIAPLSGTYDGNEFSLEGVAGFTGVTIKIKGKATDPRTGSGTFTNSLGENGTFNLTRSQ
jgi:hypothetical protein